jgi:hypothetical protein
MPEILREDVPIRLRDEAGLRDIKLQGKVVQRDPTGSPLAIGSVEDGEYRIRFPNLATFAFRPGEGEVRVASAPTTPRRVIEDLFRTAALPLMLQAEGYEAIHASAVQIPKGVVAFCGFSGAGKTTVAYGLARRGHGMWADDAVIVSMPDADRNVLTSSRLPHTINLRPESRRFFGLEQDADVAVGTAKSDEDQLVAVVVLSPDAHATLQTTLLPLDAALTAVLPHAYCFFAEEGREQKTVTAYLDLVARVPVFRLRFPNGFARFDAALDAIETRIRQAVAGL